MEQFLIVCPLVFLAGFVDSIAGGGGIISLPAYLLAGIPPHFALGTNKLSSFLGTLVTTYKFYKKGFILVKLAPYLIATALIGSYCGANLVLIIPESIIQYLLIIILPITAFVVLKHKTNDTVMDSDITIKQQWIISLFCSFIIGMYDGFYGPGTGMFLILLFNLYAKMDLKYAVGNTKIVNASSNLAALVTFIINGKVLFLLGLTASIFSILGNYIGSSLVIKKQNKIVKPIIFLVITLLFIKVIFNF